MGNYLLSTASQQQEMLEAIGLPSLDALYDSIPSELISATKLIPTHKPDPESTLPTGKSEMEVARLMEDIAGKNTVFTTLFRGAGAYRHYIPAMVNAVLSKESLVTAYTPYQPEISQGVLQSIFEYQTMICELTGLDVSNASVYDGATAAAEAVAMCRDRKRTRVLLSAAAHPDVIETIRTYSWAAGYPVDLIPVTNGVTDMAALATMLGNDTTTGTTSGAAADIACVYLPQPNYFGMIEDTKQAGALAHKSGAKFIMGINPIAAALLQSPAECGADIAVGEGQPLGMPLSFGGPYLGFMAATSGMMRKLPGRIVGATTDRDGNRAFVLTLQAREQHIRREKSASNICSNQALCAMAAAVYMAVMGTHGMEQAASQSVSKAHYLASSLQKLKGFALKHTGAFFHEFVTERPDDTDRIMDYLEKHGILGGLPIADGILWCATEMNTKAEIDRMMALIKEARA